MQRNIRYDQRIPSLSSQNVLLDESNDFQADERTNKYFNTRDSLEIIEDCEDDANEEDLEDEIQCLNATPEPQQPGVAGNETPNLIIS